MSFFTFIDGCVTIFPLIFLGPIGQLSKFVKCLILAAVTFVTLVSERYYYNRDCSIKVVAKYALSSISPIAVYAIMCFVASVLPSVPVIFNVYKRIMNSYLSIIILSISLYISRNIASKLISCS